MIVIPPQLLIIITGFGILEDMESSLINAYLSGPTFYFDFGPLAINPRDDAGAGNLSGDDAGGDNAGGDDDNARGDQ